MKMEEIIKDIYPGVRCPAKPVLATILSAFSLVKY